MDNNIMKYDIYAAVQPCATWMEDGDGIWLEMGLLDLRRQAMDPSVIRHSSFRRLPPK